MAIPALSYLRGMTLLPVIVPLVTIALELLMWPLGVKLPSWMQEPLGVSVAGMLYFGVPCRYAVLMGSLLWGLKGASMAAHVWAAALAPVLMAFVVTPAFLWILGIRGIEFWGVVEAVRNALPAGRVRLRRVRARCLVGRPQSRFPAPHGGAIVSTTRSVATAHVCSPVARAPTRKTPRRERTICGTVMD